MKKFLLLALVAFAALGLFVSCSSSSDEDADINGTWTLSTVDGAPASYTTSSLTLTVTNSASYAYKGTIFGSAANESGTVAAKSDTVYTFTSSGGNAVDYTLKGDTLTDVDPTLGVTLVFVK